MDPPERLIIPLVGERRCALLSRTYLVSTRLLPLESISLKDERMHPMDAAAGSGSGSGSGGGGGGASYGS